MRGEPLLVAFRRWKQEADTRIALKKMPQKLDAYVKQGGSQTKNFSRMSLQGKDFSKRRDLQRASFESSNCEHTNFAKVRLDKVNFYRAQLQVTTCAPELHVCSDLLGSTISIPTSSAVLRHLCAQESEMEKANLKNANMSRTRLSGANLAGAKLTGAIFDNATLDACIVNGVELPRTIITDAIFSNFKAREAVQRSARPRYCCADELIRGFGF